MLDCFADIVGANSPHGHVSALRGPPRGEAARPSTRTIKSRMKGRCIVATTESGTAWSVLLAVRPRRPAWKEPVDIDARPPAHVPQDQYETCERLGYGFTGRYCGRSVTRMCWQPTWKEVDRVSDRQGRRRRAVIVGHDLSDACFASLMPHVVTVIHGEALLFEWVKNSVYSGRCVSRGGADLRTGCSGQLRCAPPLLPRS